MTFNTNAAGAIKGEPPYEASFTDFRALLNVNVWAAYHFPVIPGFKLDTVADIRERKVPLRMDAGPRGTGGELGVSRILGAHGLSYADIRKWGGSVTFSAYPDAVGRIRDGQIHALFQNGIFPGEPWIQDLTTFVDMEFLSVTDEAVKKLEELGYVRTEIPAGTFRGQKKAYQTVMEGNVVIVHKDMREDLAYELTRIVFENRGRLARVHRGLGSLDPSVGWVGVGAPLHPGAERFYREHGHMR
jgi:uncharacterized protein